MNEFLEQFVPRVYRFALRLSGDAHLAEDLTQETFLRAVRGHGQLRDANRQVAWLFRITTNLWRDHCRRSALREERRYEAARPSSQEDKGPADLAAQDEDVRQVLGALESLPQRQREVLYLAACEELTVAQIAEVLQITPGAVKSSLSLARRQMRDRLRDRLS